MLTVQDLKSDPNREKLLARRVANLYAQNKTDTEIATELGVSRGLLDVLKRSPLFQESIAQFAETARQEGLDTIVADLRADYPKNRDFIKNVRDGAFIDKKDRMELRLRAAKMLLDKQVPNATEPANNEGAAHVIIDGRMLGQVLRALKNVGVIDVEAETITAVTGAETPKLEALTPEAFAEGYEPEER